MQLSSHIIPLPYGDHIALWNNLTGRHIVISKESFEEKENNPQLQKRLQQKSMLEPQIQDKHRLIPHRNRFAIIVDNQLWSPVPSQHHSGGYVYRSTTLSPLEKRVFQNN